MAAQPSRCGRKAQFQLAVTQWVVVWWRRRRRRQEGAAGLSLCPYKVPRLVTCDLRLLGGVRQRQVSSQAPEVEEGEGEYQCEVRQS